MTRVVRNMNLTAISPAPPLRPLPTSTPHQRLFIDGLKPRPPAWKVLLQTLQSSTLPLTAWVLFPNFTGLTSEAAAVLPQLASAGVPDTLEMTLESAEDSTKLIPPPPPPSAASSAVSKRQGPKPPHIKSFGLKPEPRKARRLLFKEKHLPLVHKRRFEFQCRECDALVRVLVGDDVGGGVDVAVYTHWRTCHEEIGEEKENEERKGEEVEQEEVEKEEEEGEEKQEKQEKQEEEQKEEQREEERKRKEIG